MERRMIVSLGASAGSTVALCFLVAILMMGIHNGVDSDKLTIMAACAIPGAALWGATVTLSLVTWMDGRKPDARHSLEIIISTGGD